MTTVKKNLHFYFGSNLNQTNNITLYNNNDSDKILISLNNSPDYAYYDFESPQSFIFALFNQKIGVSQDIIGFKELDEAHKNLYVYWETGYVLRELYKHKVELDDIYYDNGTGDKVEFNTLYYNSKSRKVKDELFATIKRFIDDCQEIHTLNYDAFEQYLLYLIGDQPNFFNGNHQICKYIINRFHNEITDNVWNRLYTESNYEMIERIVLDLYFEQNVDFTSDFLNRITVRLGENIGRVLTKINHKEDLHQSYYLKLLKYYETIEAVASNDIINNAKYNCEIVRYLINQTITNDNVFKLIDQFLIKNNTWKDMIYDNIVRDLHNQIINNLYDPITNNVNQTIINFFVSNFDDIICQYWRHYPWFSSRILTIGLWLTDDNVNYAYMIPKFGKLHIRCGNNRHIVSTPNGYDYENVTKCFYETEPNELPQKYIQKIGALCGWKGSYIQK